MCVRARACVRAVSQKTNGEYLLYKAGKSTAQIYCVHLMHSCDVKALFLHIMTT